MLQIPDTVQVVEVGPRDGFQNIPAFIPTDVKLDIIRKMIRAGIGKAEITSFVHPKAIPQMADAAEIVQTILSECHEGFQPIALIPNLYGAQRAYEMGIREVSFVISVSEAHNKANINRTLKESFNELKQIKEKFPQLHVRIDAATAFGCPFNGKITDVQLQAYLDVIASFGIDEIILCDTIGVANPRQVAQIVDWVQQRYPAVKFGLHMHDTRGMGLANALAGIQEGIRIVEAAVGGLGGCPFAPGASGNTATEDFLHMLSAMEIQTDVQLGLYMEAVQSVKARIKPELTSHLATVYWNNSTCINF